MLVKISHVEGEEPSWSLKLEGRIQNGMNDAQLLSDKSSNFRFLSFFERVKIEFPENHYSTVNWVKAKSPEGSNIDCLQVNRKYVKDGKIPFKISLFPDHQPKKYRLSP